MNRDLCSVRHRLEFSTLAILSAALLIACAGSEPPRSGVDSHSASSDPAVEVIGRRGLEPGEFHRPRAVLVDSRNRLFVIDRSGWIQRLSASGAPEKRWRLPAWDNGTPTGITLDDDGNLWVADTHYGQILVYSDDGALLRRFGEQAGTGEVLPGQLIFPTDVALDGKGNAYVTEYGVRVRVLKFTVEGEFLEEWNPIDPETGDEVLMRPMAIVYEADRDDFLIADTAHHRLVRMAPDGEIVEFIGHEGSGPGEFNYPYDVALESDGSILVCEWGNGRVQRLAPDGSPLESWGHQGRGLGELWTPWGVTVRGDGALVVADTENHRLQVFLQ